MNSIRRMVRKALSLAIVVGVVILGLVAQVGAYLFGFTTPGGTSDPERSMNAELSHSPAGTHSVGVRRIDSDEARADLTMWYPATGAATQEPAVRYSYSLAVLGPRVATALATYPGTGRLDAIADVDDGPYPLVVLSAGFAITPDSYAWLAEHLASHGIVVVAPRHEETLDPSRLWRSAIERPEVIAQTRAFIEAAAAPGGSLEGLVNPEATAVLGHSYGGYTALASGGARLDADAFTAGCAAARQSSDPIMFLCDALEPRFDDVVAGSTTEPEPVDAVVSLAGDAAMFGSAGLASVTAPVLVIGGTADHDSPFAWSTRLAYDGTSSTRKVEVALEGAEHFVFSGECGSVRRIVSLVAMGFCDDPAWDRAQARAVVRHYVTAFLLSELTEEAPFVDALVKDEAPTGVELRSVGMTR